MKIENKLRKLKKQYDSFEPSDALVRHGWQALKNELEPANPPAKKGFRYRVFLASLLALTFLGFSFGAVYASQKTLPGDTLYPVKKISEDLTVLVSGNKHVKVEKRAEEVIQAVEDNKNKEVIQRAVKNYQDEVFEIKKDSEKSGKNQEFEKQLENHEQKFEDVIKKDSSSNEEIKRAIEVSKKGRGDDGQKEEPDDSREDENGNDSKNPGKQDSD